MIFAKDSASLSIETFALHIFFAQRAIEALRMVVIIQCFHPPVSSLYGESARYTFCGEQLIPIFFTIRKSIL